MHAEPAPEPAHAESPPPVAVRPTAGEWAIGIVFVFGALSLVGWITWTIMML
jgi:hypothetical protein